jgi:glycosyltransferase involved in cell wall biosynthesis
MNHLPPIPVIDIVDPGLARGAFGGARLRVGLLMDGSEEGGVLNSTCLLLEHLNRSVVTMAGIFMGDGGKRKMLGERCDEVYDLDTGCLVPLTHPDRGRYNVPNMISKAHSFFRGAMRLADVIRRERLDLVHVNYYPLHFVAALACLMTNVPCLWHWRGANIRRGLHGMTDRLFFHHVVTRVACISRCVAESLPPVGRAKACVVYNGVPTRYIIQNQRHGELRRRLGLDKDVPLAGMFGGLTLWKGHEYFIQAAAKVLERLPQTRFVIVGGEVDVQRRRVNLEATLRALVERLHVTDQVLFTGPIPEARLYMADCDVICMPTVPFRIRGEGFGLVMAEAMAAGVATIATTCGAPPEVIEDGRSGLLVPPRDGHALTEAILTLLQNADRRKEIAQAGQRRIMEHFDISRTARAMEAVYLECARTKHAAGHFHKS